MKIILFKAILRNSIFIFSFAKKLRKFKIIIKHKERLFSKAQKKKLLRSFLHQMLINKPEKVNIMLKKDST